jgi:uncharacterized RDD family membrane protein YckC
MDIWIIRDGEKIGPIHDFEVRHQIEDGRLLASTPAWHDGLSNWKPLGEIDLFSREFLLPPTTSFQSLPDDSLFLNQKPGPPPVLVAPVLARRFWARWFDLVLYAGIWWICMWALGRDIASALRNPWIMLPHFIPWFVIEAFLIQHFATTPGKWLMGLRVLNRDGTKLNLAQSSRRCARVLFTGIGFGWDMLAIFCQLLSYFTTKRIGSSLWDYAGGHQVISEPIRASRIIALIVIFYAAIQLQLIVLIPYVVDDKVLDAIGTSYPTLKEQFIKNPPWHLPKTPPWSHPKN